jgi:hypothetical protein
MKNSLMHIHDKIILRKRAIIETVNDLLKNLCQIEHTRHRQSLRNPDPKRRQGMEWNQH